MEQKPESIKILKLISSGLISAAIAALLVKLEKDDKDGFIPWGGILAAFVVNGGLHFNLWLKGYKKVNLDRYTYTSIIFATGTLLFVYLSPKITILLFINIIWLIWIIIYLNFLKSYYKFHNPQLAITLCSIGVFLSYYSTIEYDYFNWVIITFFFASSITLLFPLLLPDIPEEKTKADNEEKKNEES